MSATKFEYCIQTIQITYTLSGVIFMNQKKQLKCYIWAGIIFVLITGTLSHFLYEWTNKNVIAGLFTTVNESIWEHMKLVFFPMLIYSSLLISKLKNTYPCIISALCFGILAGTVCIPAFFYSYTFITGKSILIIDLAIFLFSTIIAFFLSYQLTLSCKLQAYTSFLCILVLILFVCFMLFTYRPN